MAALNRSHSDALDRDVLGDEVRADRLDQRGVGLERVERVG